MKRKLFLFKIDHSIDLITNSSSELFVLSGNSKDHVVEMIKNVYSDYLNEYEELKSIDELTIRELESYFNYACSSHCWPSSKHQLPILPGFTFEELYEPEKDYQTGKQKEPAWNGQIQYELKNNSHPNESYGNFVTEENKQELINKLDPNKKMFFLFSIDENPNWNYQEQLMQIGERFHLG